LSQINNNNYYIIIITIICVGDVLLQIRV